MITKSNSLMTFGGILTAFCTTMVGLPLAVLQYYAQIVKSGPPPWFNACVFPMILFGFIGTAVGTAIMGVAGKGADQHSTINQVEQATAAVAEKPVAVPPPAPAKGGPNA